MNSIYEQIINRNYFIPGLDRLVEPLRATCTTKVKAHSVKQEFEKQDELKRSAMRAVASLLAIADAGWYISVSFLVFRYHVNSHLVVCLSSM